MHIYDEHFGISKIDGKPKILRSLCGSVDLCGTINATVQCTNFNHEWCTTLPSVSISAQILWNRTLCHCVWGFKRKFFTSWIVWLRANWYVRWWFKETIKLLLLLEPLNIRTFEHCIESLDIFFFCVLSDGRLLLVLFFFFRRILEKRNHCRALFIFQRERD